MPDKGGSPLKAANQPILPCPFSALGLKAESASFPGPDPPAKVFHRHPPSLQAGSTRSTRPLQALPRGSSSMCCGLSTGPRFHRLRVRRLSHSGVGESRNRGCRPDPGEFFAPGCSVPNTYKSSSPCRGRGSNLPCRPGIGKRNGGPGRTRHWSPNAGKWGRNTVPMRPDSSHPRPLPPQSFPI